MNVYEEYKKEHPEELEKLEAILSIGRGYEKTREERRQIKRARIEKWRKIKNGESPV